MSLGNEESFDSKCRTTAKITCKSPLNKPPCVFFPKTKFSGKESKCESQLKLDQDTCVLETCTPKFWSYKAGKDGIKMEQKISQNKGSIILNRLKKLFNQQKESVSSMKSKQKSIFYDKKGIIRYPKLRMLSYERRHHIENSTVY